MKKSLLLLGLALSACNGTTEPSSRQLAYIGVQSQRSNLIVAPDTVRAGQSVGITVYAIGSGVIECNQPDGSSTSQDAGVVRIEAYMRLGPRGRYATACTDDARRYPYQTSATFATIGTHTIRLIGSSRTVGEPVVKDSVERTVVVIP